MMKSKDKRLLILGGVLIVGGYFLLKKQSSATVIPVGDNTPVIDTSGYTYDPVTGKPLHPDTYTPAAPVPVVMTVDRANYIYNLQRFITDPAYTAIFNRMTDAELLSTWRYVGTYIADGTPLVASVDLKLYNAMQAIHSKYGIF